MASIIRVDIETGRLENRLKRTKNLPVASSKAIMEWGKILQRDISSSARTELSEFSGSLFSKILWKQRPRGKIGELTMPLYGVFVDRMRPHVVSINKSRSVLLGWAKQAQHPEIRRGANAVSQGRADSFPLFVEPHPFIRKGWRRARPKLRTIMKRHARMAVGG